MPRPLVISLLLSMLFQAPHTHAAGDGTKCSPATLDILGRALQVSNFAPAAYESDRTHDPREVIVSCACRRLNAQALQTVVAVAWDSGEPNGKTLTVAKVDDASAEVVAMYSVFVNETEDLHFGAQTLGLDGAGLDIAPLVRAFAVDLSSEDRSCASEHLGPQRMLFVQEGKTLRPVLSDFYLSRSRFVEGAPSHCSKDLKPSSTLPAVEKFAMTIRTGEVGQTGWRDLILSAKATRTDHGPARPPLRVRVPYADEAYSLEAFYRAFDEWSR